MPRIRIPLLSSSIHLRICPGMYFVRAACRTMVLAFAGGLCGGGVRSGVRVGVRSGVRVGVAAVVFVINAAWSGCNCGKISPFFAGIGVSFGPAVGCFPLSFLLVFGDGAVPGGGVVVEVAASA